MLSTLELIGLPALVLTGAVLLARWDTNRQETGETTLRNLRGLAVALLCLAATAPLTAAVALGLSDQPLPVKPPGNPGSCSSSSSGDGWVWLVVVLVLAAIRLGPAFLGFLIARRRATQWRPVVTGRLTFLVASACLGLITLAVIVRLLMGGYVPADFTTYGALTPPGAKGWRARTVIRRHQMGKLNPLSRGDAIACDKKSSGSCMSGGPHEVIGLKAWIGGDPVNIARNASGVLIVQPVIRSTVSPARRPHFDRLPEVTRATSRPGSLLVGRQNDGSWLAVRFSSSRLHTYLLGASRGDVGLLLCPPSLPLCIALALAALGFLLWFLTRGLRGEGRESPTRAWGQTARLGSAALLVEAAMLLYGAYRIYF